MAEISLVSRGEGPSAELTGMIDLGDFRKGVTVDQCIAASMVPTLLFFVAGDFHGGAQSPATILHTQYR